MPEKIGRVYQDKGNRWLIRLKGGQRIFCDKNHQSFYSREHCQHTLIRICGEIEAGTFDSSFYAKKTKSLLSFDEYCRSWLTNCERRLDRGELSPSYLKEMRRFTRKIFIPYFGNQSMLEIKGFHLKQFYLSLDVHPKTCSNIMGALHKIFVDALDEEIIPAIPNFPKIGRIPEPGNNWASEEEQDYIMGHLDPDEYYAIFFLVCHGIRPGELRALKHKDIDLKNDTVTIRRSVSNNIVRETTKGKRQRVIPLDPNWRELYLKRPRALDKDTLIFLKDGMMLSETWLGKCLRKACDQAGVDRIRLYDLTRHSLASQAANRGESLYLIQRQLGHTSSRMTQRYAHLQTQALLAIRRKTVFSKLSVNQETAL